MNKSAVVLITRLALGALGGFALQHFFFPRSGWVTAVILAALVVAAAYVSEGWRSRKKD